MAAIGTPRIAWYGKDFAATTEIVKLGAVEITTRVPDILGPFVRRSIVSL